MLSAANPLITPEDIIDEVVTARGSKATLDARLDIALNDDGTLKTQASLLTLAQYQAGLGSRNVAVNGDLADWTAGGAAAPDGFALTGGGATIARTGIGEVDTTHFGTGSGYAAKVTRVGNDWKLTQALIAGADFAKFVNVKGQKFSVAMKGQTAVAAHLRISVDDGAAVTSSSYHTGDNVEAHLSVTHTISAGATKLDVYAEGKGSNGDAYVGGFIFVFADSAPSDWQPYSVIGDASATSKGVVNTGAQTMAGAKTWTGQAVFSLPPTFKPGTVATADATTIGVIGTNVNVVGNVGAGEDDLHSYTVKAGTLAAVGKCLRFTFTGKVAANGNAKQIRVRYGAALLTFASTNANDGYWRIVVEVTYTGAATQEISGTLNLSATTGTLVSVVSVAGTVDNAVNATAKVTAEATNDNDVTCRRSYVEVI